MFIHNSKSVGSVENNTTIILIYFLHHLVVMDILLFNAPYFYPCFKFIFCLFLFHMKFIKFYCKLKEEKKITHYELLERTS